VNDDTQQGERRLGRSIEVLAFGDNADEIELAALDEARKFFGRDIHLEVVRDYRVLDVRPGGALEAKAGGKGYQATVTVREPS
jgi:hypothetical protein